MSVYIIAEAGVNHNGSIILAKKLADKAKESGADCIKFQTFISSKIVSKSAEMAEYQKKNTGHDENQLSMLKRLELSFSEFIEINQYCKQIGLEFLSTAFDFESLGFLATLNMSYWKIPSGEITNYPYLVKIAKMNKPVILSTGMSTLEEVKDAYNVLKKEGCEEITILQCTTEYPTMYEDVNLSAMITMQREFNTRVGCSDHTKGIEVPIAAVALGASIIEKHFTLDNTMEGPDHKASLEPDELKAMVIAIRNIERAIGNGIKIPAESELKNIAIARKSIIASINIKEGETLSEKNITVKRPGQGISPMRWNEVIGKQAKRDFQEDEMIEL
jgi:N,N'-diacetyllegionaminate synthase